jgi:amino acid adenylation domain-containing protein
MTTLYEWFAGSVARTPDAVALEVGDDTLTYAALSRRVDAVATRVLAANGGRAPRRVALLASRSLTAFTGYLAALRLGAAVVPLNPGHPVYRNELVCGSVGLDVLVVDENGAAQVSALGASVGAVLALSDDEVRSAVVGELPTSQVGQDDPAYVLFTSGSTGRPKGVPITHANVAAYVGHNIERFDIGPGCRVSHTFDFTFDPSVFDLFVTWGGGATLVCPHRTDLLYPVDYLVDKRITHWFSVPSVVSVSANLGNLPIGRETVLRQSVFIGEQLTFRQATAWHAIAPDAAIANVYGPTELTVACTEYRLPADPARWPSTSNDTVPIGPVYDFLDHLILGEDGRPATEGELCVRGVQRFAGYMDPADNPNRFMVADGDRFVPYDGTEPRAEYYYRTGDRVRWENGELVHLSRLDHQLKIRGYRVETGEIEAAIARHDGVTQAVVVTIPGDDAPQLVAFYTGARVPDRQFVRWLRDRLPIYMVPRRLNHLDELPLNPNGKVDRGVLRDSVLSTTS